MTHLNKDNCTYYFINAVIRNVVIDTTAIILMIWWIIK